MKSKIKKFYENHADLCHFVGYLTVAGVLLKVYVTNERNNMEISNIFGVSVGDGIEGLDLIAVLRNGETRKFTYHTRAK